MPEERELAVVSSCRADEVVCDALGFILLQRHVALITQRQVAQHERVEDELCQKAGIGIDELHRTAGAEAEADDIGIAHRVIIAEARDVGLKEVLRLAGGELIVSQATGTLTEGLLKLMALLADELRLVPRGIAAL